MAKRKLSPPQQVEVKRQGVLDLSHLRPCLRLRAADVEAGQGELTFQFKKTPVSPTRTVTDAQEFLDILAKETRKGDATHENWLRQPARQWCKQMVAELPKDRRRRLRQRYHILEESAAAEEDFMNRWGDTSDFASAVLEYWLEDKSLEEVLERAKQLGQMEEDLFFGCFLQGSYVDSFAWAEDLCMEALRGMVKKIEGSESFVFHTHASNCFEQAGEQIPVDELQPWPGSGSLNTRWDYSLKGSERTDVDLLDDYFVRMQELVEKSESVRLNKMLYLIWKMPHYVTSYHQDTHVPPHFTVYNQVSGASVFHFLPPLVGCYVTHVGRRDVSALKEVLERLDAMQLGSLAVLGPGQVALISPFGSHGVWVPSKAYNEKLPGFSVSAIRAVELFMREQLRVANWELKLPTWNQVWPENEEDEADMAAYRQAQRALCLQQNFTQKDWQWLTRKHLKELKERNRPKRLD
ncbi:hypothetical protein AK812_SmicGene11106 [Symbiodinium microadriaticum]|uniref:Uncharacterized protein n=1 Tax=Symbiodinium microadriaticum TaxID=2951 RepID=A0A1Q9EE30_SYMMI|nr:hypothetical protein AK812_SmicGene11106 [Symbiodinium microadriaticum]